MYLQGNIKEKKMPKSALYQSAITNRKLLSDHLTLIEEYLEAGEATTEIYYYGANNSIIRKYTKTSKWSTSIGKQRVRTSHEIFVSINTGFLPRGTKRMKVKSPFVENETKTVLSSMPVTVQCQSIAI